jgi:putative chitinase
MGIHFDRDAFFDSVRGSLFSGSMSQQQVDGMNFKLDVWEDHPYSDDLRWLAYAFATSYHETSATMWPIEEYGKGEGMSYGEPDPETGECYYGRGDVQLTWAENYQRATRELDLIGEDDLYLNPDRALYPPISADVMYIGMVEGWFREAKDGTKETLAKYFNDSKEDAYTAREIINGDKSKVPSWSHGVSIGNLIKGYYQKFLTALTISASDTTPEPAPEPEPGQAEVRIDMVIAGTPGTRVRLSINGADMDDILVLEDI